ncbi:DUF1772-domain-containing protein [Myriangium duriaei CBS 260.36]|uniref:DUF1772-domain-containing protein n=1 Tax=Myriangium duriaei CBS 260.36 TaxID=1168546 RepID=A0A9P4IXQ1_9PEZI|nr:DUF1772-domain-containing protein [Myriangium duriaei CBS 260.36]
MSSPSNPQLLTSVGLGTAFFYGGFSFCASSLVVPLLYPLPARHSTTFFKDFFYNGASTVVPVALLSTTSLAVGSYLLSSSQNPAANNRFYGWKSSTLGYIAAAVVIAGMPWTQLVMMPINNRLIELSADSAVADKAAREVLELLQSWRWMNFVRAGCGFFGGVIGFAALAGQR